MSMVEFVKCHSPMIPDKKNFAKAFWHQINNYTTYSPVI